MITAPSNIFASTVGDLLTVTGDTGNMQRSISNLWSEFAHQGWCILIFMGKEVIKITFSGLA